MDTEFHYYVTYLIAAKAGFGPDEAEILAYGCQYTDDNNFVVKINPGEKGLEYGNYISQTVNITKPAGELLRIHPLFHFIPGDPVFDRAYRRDGAMHWLNTTPDSGNARQIMDAALESDNAYRLGIALHAYADTWSHQNFAGY